MSQSTALVPRFVNISEAYNLFRLRCQAERVQPSTLRFYGWTLQPFFAWCEAQHVTELGDITAHHIHAYLHAAVVDEPPQRLVADKAYGSDPLDARLLMRVTLN